MKQRLQQHCYSQVQTFYLMTKTQDLLTGRACSDVIRALLTTFITLLRGHPTAVTFVACTLCLHICVCAFKSEGAPTDSCLDNQTN